MATSYQRKRVEIGVLEELDNVFLFESRYFPSKIGGKPAWLNLKDLPSNLNCDVCKKPCVFLCQLYAPVDNIKHCHHRTIFLFICQDGECSEANKNKNLKIFRCQLPAVNEFYVEEDPIEVKSWHPESSVEKYSKICTLCGNPAPFNCGKCKKTFYCSKLHQKIDWGRYRHKDKCGLLDEQKDLLIETPFLFPQLEICIESAPEIALQVSKSDDECKKEYEELVQKLGDSTLSSVSAQEIELYSAVKEDKYFAKYKNWITVCGEHVIRYQRGGEPLYVSKPTEEHKAIPACEYCGSNRQFEFQIMSTLLNELGENYENRFDWGSLLVYTCTQHCNDGPAYKNEFILKQDFTE